MLALSARTVISNNVMGCVWAKMCKATVDITTALVDADASEVRCNKATHRVRIELIREAVRVAQAEGVRVERFEHFDPAPFTDTSPAGLAAAGAVLDEMGQAHTSSSTKVRTGYWRDIVYASAKQRSITLPARSLVSGKRTAYRRRSTGSSSRCVEEIEAGRRPMVWKNIEELAAAVP